MDTIKSYLEKFALIMPKNNRRFNGFADLILHYGKEYKNISQKKFTKGVKKQCFQNAFNLAMENEKLIYCEGFAISKVVGFPFEHAWCIDENENVIDNTWDDGVAYFGIAFTTDFIYERANKTGVYGVFGIGGEKKWFISGFKQHELWMGSEVVHGNLDTKR